MNGEFAVFPKMARWSRPVVVTEKLDGTNAQILIEKMPEVGQSEEYVTEPLAVVKAIDGYYGVWAGSRNRWLRLDSDNFGFARWVFDEQENLVNALGPGRHFGEWWGNGIQRNYKLPYKRFSLFNTERWAELPYHHEATSLILRVPVCYAGEMYTGVMDDAMDQLKETGSLASPGFMQPEGVVLFHIAGNVGFKKTFENDEGGKNEQ